MKKTLPLLLLAATTGVSHAAITSFTDSFNGYTLNGAISSPWSFANSGADATQKITQISGANLGYSMTLTNSANTYGAVSVGSGSDFVTSVRFKMDALTSGGSGSTTINHSLNALASSTLGSGYRLNFVTSYSGSSIQNAGKLVLAEQGSTGLAGTLTSTGTYFLTSSDVGVGAQFYTLKLTGTYSGGNLILEGFLLDGSGATLLSTSGTDATIQTGTYFGMRFASNGATNTGTVTYDDFSVLAVPEPAAAGLAGIGLLGLLARRRSSSIG